MPITRTISIWGEVWEDPTQKLSTLLRHCTQAGAIISHGREFDHWDLEAKGGAFGSARLRMGVEEHGHGKQLTRFRVYPHILPVWIWLIALLASILVEAAYDSAWIAFSVIGIASALLLLRILKECGTALSALISGIGSLDQTREN